MSEVNLVDQTVVQKKLPTRLLKNKVIKSVFFVCTLIGLIVLAIL
ncbi:phosphate ABC transporter, permease protein PstA, partial [Mammaliicoccus vitulinus]